METVEEESGTSQHVFPLLNRWRTRLMNHGPRLAFLAHSSAILGFPRAILDSRLTALGTPW